MYSRVACFTLFLKNLRCNILAVLSVFVVIGIVLVTDAISAMGLESGTHHLGQQKIEIKGDRAVVAGTDTLCGRYEVVIHHMT